MSLRNCLAVAVLASITTAAAFSQDSANHPRGEQIDTASCGWPPNMDSGATDTAVCTKRAIDDWLLDIQRWRKERLIRIGFDDASYRLPQSRWTQSSFIQTQAMVHDRSFYDPATGSYTVDRYLDDLTHRYGGIDSVLLWHVYPNLGIDDRNQFDFFNDLPGGVPALRAVIARFHARGVHVLFPVVLWDQGTRAEPGDDWDALIRELIAVGADGINGDTLEGVPRTYQQRAMKLGHPLVAEPEAGLASNEMLNYNLMSWAYFDYSFAPPLSLYKWLEPQHMVHVCNRWAHNHTDDLQAAFFNGTGFESWENIWGIWNQLTPRDAEALRRISTIERAEASLLTSGQWEPDVFTNMFGVFASMWPGEKGTLWTLVNRNSYAVHGGIFTAAAAPGARYFDLWHGIELHPSAFNGKTLIQLELEPNGYGAVLETREDAPLPSTLLETMSTLSRRPLSTYSTEWAVLPQQIVSIPPTKIPKNPPAGMILIPGGDYEFRVHGIEIEGGNDEGVDVQYPWENSPRRYHAKHLHLNPFWIDKYPVTNAEFKRFLDETRYRPKDDHNFLKDWVAGAYPAGAGNRPVTWVSIEDARAYAAWAGKRLPHEWEWQFAAQGNTGREYPWGTSLISGAHPSPDHGRNEAPASNVDAFPRGASVFGVMDLTRNVWQWTDEYRDGHTRAAIVRGGSHYEPLGSRWYFPQERTLSEHGKYLLMAPSLDRSGSIGFRCVMDADVHVSGSYE